ncbi:MAG: hypothetical protein ACTSUV_03300 [Candidatus Ranarchaeia archaeon]
MGLLSPHETIVWEKFHQGLPTGEIASKQKDEEWTLAYVSRVLNRARKKIKTTLTKHAASHRLDTDSILDYNGILIGFDYAANSEVYIIFTIKLGVVVWYKHASYAGKLCPNCPKEKECRETLDTILEEYNITLRPQEKKLNMTDQSITIFNKLIAKEPLRYKRKKEE